MSNVRFQITWFCAITACLVFVIGCGERPSKQTSGDRSGLANSPNTDSLHLSVKPLFTVQEFPVNHKVDALAAGVALDEIVANGWGQPSPGVCIHMLRMQRFTEYSQHPDDFEHICNKLRSLIFDAQEYQKKHMGIPILLDTAYGAQYRIVPPPRTQNYDLASMLGAIAHRDQVLAILFENQETLDASMTTPSQRKLTTHSLLTDSVASFDFSHELEWSLIAYCGYVKPVKFRNSKNQTFSLADLALRLLKNPEGLGSCHGCHRLYALSIFCERVNHEANANLVSATDLSELQRVKGLIESYFKELSIRLATTQHLDGYWNASLFKLKGNEVNKPFVDNRELGNRIRAAGHLLEWMAITPPEFRPNNHSILKAIRYLELQILQDPEFYADKFLLAASHALASLLTITEE